MNCNLRALDKRICHILSDNKFDEEVMEIKAISVNMKWFL